MKFFIMLILGLQTLATAAQREVYIECIDQGGKGDSVYQVVSEQREDHKGQRFFFVKKDESSNEQSVPIEAPLLYGGSLIVLKNAGKSGYLHFYAHQNGEVLLDINLFTHQHRKFNTNGPLKGLNCK